MADAAYTAERNALLAKLGMTSDPATLSLAQLHIMAELPGLRDTLEIENLLNNRLEANSLAVGEATLPRDIAVATTVPGGGASQALGLSYFTAKKTETTSQVRVITGGTAAGATPSLCKIGLYTVNNDGSLTLVASTASDTTLFAAANTAYTKSWATAYQKVAGQRYALGILVVTAAAMPTFAGALVNQVEPITVQPVLCSKVTGQADLPASISAGTPVLGNSRFYGVVLP